MKSKSECKYEVGAERGPLVVRALKDTENWAREVPPLPTERCAARNRRESFQKTRRRVRLSVLKRVRTKYLWCLSVLWYEVLLPRERCGGALYEGQSPPLSPTHRGEGTTLLRDGVPPTNPSHIALHPHPGPLMEVLGFQTSPLP
ncbi:unnamed protein product [Gadus morhua 'NCC']